MTPRDLLLALLANMAWAFNFIAGKYGMQQFEPLLFTALRFSLLLLLLGPLFLRPIPGQMRTILTIGLVNGVIHFGLMFAGLNAGGDVSSIAILTQLYVPFSALLAVLFLGEQLGWRRIGGIGVAFAGVMLIGFDPVVFQHPDAVVLITGAALAMASTSILMRRLKGVGVFHLQAWIALVAAPGLLMLSLLLEDGQWQALTGAQWRYWLGPAYTAIGGSIIGHGIVYYLLTRYPVGLTNPLMLLTPVLAVIFGVTLWGDTLTWKLVVGGLMVLAGVLVITVRMPRLFRARQVY
ncbi:MAG: DMT family transporter [Candidatus Competibacteraceae bacterium]|nr:DMT family transporter [Candidatus Competibacteraceae bacterium]